MSKKNRYPGRAFIVQKADELFFDPYNARRTHKRGYEMFLKPRYGFCEDTCRNDRKSPTDPEARKLVPHYILLSMKLEITLVKNLQQHEAERVLEHLCLCVESGIKHLKSKRALLTADAVERYMAEAVQRIPRKQK